jgi:hypothetical protein
MAPRRKAATPKKSSYTYQQKPFIGNPYNLAAIAEHHDAVAAAPWLAGMATAEPAPAPSPRLRVLCVLDGVAIAEMELRARLVFASLDLDVTDKDEPIDDVHGEVKVGGKWVKVVDYDLVFLDNETASVRYLAAGLPPSRVAFVANVKAEHHTEGASGADKCSRPRSQPYCAASAT